MTLLSTLNADALTEAIRKNILPGLTQAIGSQAGPLIDQAIDLAMRELSQTVASAETQGLNWIDKLLTENKFNITGTIAGAAIQLTIESEPKEKS